MPETAIATPVAPTASAAPTPVAAPAPVERNFTQMMAKVAAQTTVADTPAPVQEVVKIVPNAPPKADAHGSADLPPGSVPPPTAIPDVVAAPHVETVADVASDTPTDTPPSAAPELVGEIQSEEDGLRLTAERNADGTFKTKLDPTQKFDFAIKDKATGETKTYSKTIPELMRMAKDGIEGMRLRTEVQQHRQEVPQLREEVQSLTALLQDQYALNRELLSAPDELVIQRREQYAKEMAPENRLARENEELRRKADLYERQTQATEHNTRRDAFMQSRGITTAIQNAEAVLGVEVVAGKLSLATAPLLVNGVIPPDRWPVLEQYIKGPFSQWVAAESTRKQTQDREAALARQATAEAQRKAQTTVNDTARTLVPVGRAAADAPPELPKPKNVQEAVNRMVHRPLPPTVAGIG